MTRWVALVLCLLGLGVSGYLTYEHLTASTSLACPDTGVVNCLKVTTSSYSRVLGIPVAPLGLAFFVAMTVLCLPPLWRAGRAWSRPVRLLRLAAATSGVAFVVYLVWAELFRLDAICLWCSAVHVVTVVLFGVLVVDAALAPVDPAAG